MSMPPTPAASHNPQPEFTHAIQYINRIKTRFADEPETYKQFLEILQMYQKEQRVLQDVYDQVTRLFRGAPDLIDEFKMFLPDTNTTSSPSMLTLGAGASAGVRKTAPDDASKEGPPTKKRRSVPDKDSVGSTIQHTLLHTHNAIPSHPHTLTHVPIPSHPHTIHVTHGAVLTHPPHALHVAHATGPPPLPPPAQPLPPPPEIFFDRLKRALDDRDSWEDFVKLLTMYSMNVLDESLLLQIAAPFLGGIGSELEVMFRELMGVGIDGKRRDDTNGNLNLVMNNGAELPRVPGHAHGFGTSGSTGATAGMGSVYLTGSKYQFGSYRRLPECETKLACSGRDELSRSVLNDEWVSHPTWASEDSGFVAHKKNTYEEAMHKSEEERHEYHVQLEAMAYTISLLEPISLKINNMSLEERSTFRLSPSFGGRSKSIHQKIIKKVYNRENASEVLQALQDNPAVAVPVVLERLKLVDAEWKKNKREWEKVWREVDARNFYKSLDHQGVSFKANDKKTITGKALLAEIERIKGAQDLERDGQEEESGGSDGRQSTQFRKPTSTRPRYQLRYSIIDPLVLQDVIKLTLYFLERNDSRQGGGASVPQYNTIERRRIEAFLRHYVKFQFDFSQKYALADCAKSANRSLVGATHVDANMIAMEAMSTTISPAEFDLAFGPPVGKEEWEELGLYVPDASGSLVGTNGTDSEGGSTAAVTGRGDESPALKSNVQDIRAAHHEQCDDIWIRHVKVEFPKDESVVEGGEDAEPQPLRYPKKKFSSFFCNNNFYTLIRMLQLLYSRLLTCKELAAKLAIEGPNTFLPNPVAFGLGLTDIAGPLAYFGDLAVMVADNRASSSSLSTSLPKGPNNVSLLPTPNGNPGEGQNPQSRFNLNPAEHFYNHLLDLVEKMFDGELEQATFEENMRFMFGTRAFIVFTLDKLCGAICKQVQAVVQDSRCHELMNVFEQQRGREMTMDEDGGVQATIRYRRQAEALVGSDENLFRVDWDPEKRSLCIQLLDLDDLSLDPPDPDVSRQYYLPKAIAASVPEAPIEAMNMTPEKISARLTLGWKQYVDSYVLTYPTEGRRIGAGRKVFLRRTLLDESCEVLNDSQWVTDTSRGGMEIMIGPGTCKLYYTRGCEEAGWRVSIKKAHWTSIGGTEKSGGGGSAKSRTNGKKRRAPSNEEAEVETVVDEWERLKERAETRKRERRRWMVDKGF